MVDRMLSRERADRPTLSEVFDVLRAQIPGNTGAEPVPAPPPPPMAIRRTPAPEAGGTMTTMNSSLRAPGELDTAPGTFAASAPRTSQARGWIAGAALAALGLAGWWALQPAVEPTTAAEPTADAEATSVTAPTTAPEVPLPRTATEVAAVPTPPQAASSVATQTRRPARSGAPPAAATASSAAPSAPPTAAAAAAPKPTGTLQGAVVDKPPF
jgi:hypothetical protein